MDEDGNGNYSQLRYLDPAILKFITEQMQNKYTNLEEFYDELKSYEDQVKGMESAG